MQFSAVWIDLESVILREDTEWSLSYIAEKKQRGVNKDPEVTETEKCFYYDFYQKERE